MDVTASMRYVSQITAGELDQMTFKGPFQLSDSMKQCRFHAGKDEDWSCIVMEEAFKASSTQLHRFQKTLYMGAKCLGRCWREQHRWVESGT